MKRRSILIVVIQLVITVSVFAQTGAGALRDYVGLINQTYHPDVVSYFEKMKADFEKDGEKDVVKAIELFLRGDTGSGFIISDASGTNYVVTNNHVIAQAYTLSITFERQDGFKRTYNGLKIIAVDEEIDLAVLAFAPGDKPVQQGLTFLTRPVEEGEDVFSAGFPGIGTASVWQFGRGMVSNAIARFPKSIDDETLMGPFVQHTAQVDPGNSGGPLLVAQRGAPSGYAVVGVNTLSALWRQAANYAIPVSTVQPVINAAWRPQPSAYRTALDERLAKFTEGLGGDKAVYPHIAAYLSAACLGENAEYAMSELLEKAPRTVQRDFINKCEDSLVGAMGYAVAWTIENSIRSKGVIKASLKEVTGAGEEYTAIFTINDKDVSTKWVREYGNWRIRTFGEIAAGDKNLVAKKESRREAEKNLRTSTSLLVEGGYAQLLGDVKPKWSLYASATFFSMMGLRLYYNTDFMEIDLFVRAQFPVKLNSFAIIPFGTFGFSYVKNDNAPASSSSAPPIQLGVQLGLKFTMAKVPGLYAGVAFQFNFFDVLEFMDRGLSGGSGIKRYKTKALALSVGYAL
jgi:serine protease Do